MKQIIILIIVIGVITGLYLYLEKEDPPISKTFSVKQDFDKIFLSDMEGQSVILSKNKNGKWMLNKTENIRPDAIKILINTIKKVRVKTSVPKAQRENIYKKISAENIKVEIYNRNEKLTTYYVGGPTNDYEGTYFFHDKSKDIYITHIPGFTGYLTPRYFVDKEIWKDRTIINYNKDHIRSVTVHYYNKDTSSFELVTKPLNIKLNDTQSDINDIDLHKVNLYLNGFKKLEIEGFENNYINKDSILNSPEFCRLKLIDKNKNLTELRLFKMPISKRSKLQYNKDGKALKYDLDRLFVDINRGEDFGVLQLYVFNKILVKPAFFLK